MKRFRFRLERVLQYRASLVEQQEIELMRRLAILRKADARLLEAKAAHERALQSVEGILLARSNDARWLLAPASQSVASAREHLRACRKEKECALAAVMEAQAELLRRRQDEQVLQKLKERQAKRAKLEASRDEVKEVDDMITTRLNHRQEEIP